MTIAQQVQPSALGLKAVTLLADLPAPTLEEVARQCRWRRYQPEQRIISREASDNDVYLIVSGRVRVTAYSACGREVMFGEMHAGACFGDYAAIDGRGRSADVVAIEETLVAAMSPTLFKRLLREYPAICEGMMRRLVERVRDLTARVYEFSTLGVQNRVHAEILRLARAAGVKDNTARIEPAPTHAEIGSQISTYREQVTRELSAMAKQGLVQRAGHALVVRDVARLEKIVAEVRRST
jgi:CRP-like cAMP-binding protein